MFPRVERALEFFVRFFCLQNASWWFFVIFFHVWNALWYFVLYFFVWTVLCPFVIKFSLCVKSSRVFCVINFCFWNSLWYFVFYFSACGTLSVILWCIFFVCGTNSGILCYIFSVFSPFFVVLYLPCFPLIFLFCLFETIFDLRAVVLCNFVLHFSACGMFSGIV